ncbi:MAG: tyrosine--tRNA ligase [Patescibacteria group bacterium]|nr:tyrosine--tRNA ligase [Patescibacteria group bacterium]
MTDDIKNKIDQIFDRGVAELIDPGDKFKEKIIAKASGNYSDEIIIKFGVDPTRPDIHLGHAVVFRKLRELQDLGCKVVFLIGDFTAQIGDPSGKSKVRPELAQAEVEANMKTFVEQAGKILLTEKHNYAWITNSSWFYSVTDLVFDSKVTVEIKSGDSKVSVPANSFVGKAAGYERINLQKNFTKNVVNITFRGFLSTLRGVTHGQLVQRDFFQDRIKKGEELYMNEMMYPVLQGIDSHAIAKVFGSCDLEIGGTDQTFNMLMGRDVMKMNKQEPQAVFALELLSGLDGDEKMSKSSDNYIAITDDPKTMYGKTMSLPDNFIVDYFRLCTYTPLAEVEKINKQLSSDDTNPRDIKMRLAREIIAIYHGDAAAQEAEESFVDTFSKKNIPDDLLEVEAKEGEKLADVLLRGELVKSKSDFRRLLEEGALHDLDAGETLTDLDATVKDSWRLKIGKRRFLVIKIK